MKKTNTRKLFALGLLTSAIAFGGLGVLSMNGQKTVDASAAGTTFSYALSAADNVQLTSLGGKDKITGSISGPGVDDTPITSVAKTTPTSNGDGSYSLTFNQWGYTLGTAFTFTEPIKADSVKGLSIKIKLTESESYEKTNDDGTKIGYGYYNIRQWGMNNAFFWDSVGIHLLGAENSGEKSLLLDPYFPLSDGTTWSNWVVMGENLLKLADEDGYVSGFRIAGGFCQRFFGLQSIPSIVIGEVSVVETVKVTYKVDDEIYKTEEKGKGIEAPTNYTPAKLGYDFLGWTLNGADYTDFTTPVSGDMTLVAKFAPSSSAGAYRIVNAATATFDGSREITGINGDNTMGGYAEPDYAFKIADKNADVDTAGGYLTYPIHNWGYRIYKVTNFAVAVKADEIDALSFRIKAHLSSASSYGGWDGAKFANAAEGIWFLGANSLGEKGDGILLDPFVKQDEWIYLTVTGEDLLKLADEDGYIRGFRVAASTIDGNGSGQSIYNSINGVLQAYVAVDEVIVNTKKTITYKDGDTVLKSTEGFSFVTAVDYIPEKAGYVFCGWLDNENDFVPIGSTVGASNMMLYADFKPLAGEALRAENAGLYQINGGAYSGKYVGLFADGKVTLPEGVSSSIIGQYAADGKVYAYGGQSLETFDLAACTKVDYWTVTYNYGDLGYIDRAMIERGTAAKQPTVVETGVEILRWSLDNKQGAAYDFADIPTDDITLYAITHSSAERYLISSGADGFTESVGTLTAINGVTSINNYNVIVPRGLNSVKLDETMSQGSDDGYAFRVQLGGWGIFLSTAIEFEQKIPVSELDGLTFRLWTHLSPRENYTAFYASGQGYRIYGIGADGSTSGVLIPLNIKQDQWTDFTLTKSEVAQLADKDGYFSGFMIASGVMVDDSAECNGYGGAALELYGRSPYIFVDSVSANYAKTVTYYDGEQTMSEQTLLTGESVPFDYFPTKEGKAFTGWTLYGEEYALGAIYQSMPLFANWVDSVAIPRGIYTKGEEEFTLYENGKIERAHDSNYSGKISYPCLFGADGVLYVYNTDEGMEKITLVEWTKAEICVVTIQDGADSTLIYVEKGSLLDGKELSKDGYDFNGYATASGDYALTTPVNGDLTLTVRWSAKEIPDTEYAEYVGKYYDSVSKTYVVLSEDKQAEYDGNTVVYKILVNGEIFLGDVVGTAMGEYLVIDGKTYDKMETCTVSFYSNGGSAVEKQTITPDSPYAVKPVDPTRTGYKFLGWTTEKNGDEYYDFAAVVTSSIEIFAKWERIPGATKPGDGASSDTDNVSGGDAEEGGCAGCGGVVDGMPVIVTLALLGVGVVLRKKHTKGGENE